MTPALPPGVMPKCILGCSLADFVRLTKADYAQLPRVPAILLEADLGHGGTLTQPNGGTDAVIATAWLNWWLKGDRKARQYFSGPRCGLCANPNWKVQSKRLP